MWPKQSPSLVTIDVIAVRRGRRSQQQIVLRCADPYPLPEREPSGALRTRSQATIRPERIVVDLRASDVLVPKVEYPTGRE